MSNPVVANIIKSGGAVWYAPVGESRPDETTVVHGAAWGGNWVRIGYTKEPLKYIYEDERHTVEVQEALTGVRVFRIKEDARLETVLSELTPAYYEFARGGDPTSVVTTAAGAGQRGFEELKIGGEVVVNEWAIGFEGMYLDSSGNKFPVRIFTLKAVVTLNGELTFSQKEDDHTGVPIKIDALADTSQSSGEQLLDFQRVTTEATS